MSDRKNEELIMNSNIIQINNFIYDVCKSICKIIINSKVATGFLLKLYKRDEPFYCLMTNEHVITHDMVDNEEELEIFYDNQRRRNKIILNKEERFIRDYTFINIDAIVIEILNKDNINDYFFLLPNLDYINDFDSLLHKKISVTQFPEGGCLSHSEGELKSITQYEFSHLASTKNGSSGSPIFLDNVPYVIGIHKQGKIDGTENYGDFIGPVVESIKKDLEFTIKKYDNGNYEGEIKNDMKEGYGKYTTDDGTYYIGQFSHDLRHGKGADYYQNNSIMHEGDFENDVLDGNGKFYDIDGSYYIGQFSNWMKHGKGTEYYPDGKIKYEGNYVNGKREGKGKYIYKSGDYYIGDFLDDAQHGQGIEYYKNGTIKYEGEFINNLYEGKGKYIYEEGPYYIGNFSKGMRQGKGIEYYKNNTILYEGDFSNDEKEGYGKYIWETGEYYIGQFLKGEKHGKGTEYRKDGTIKYEGEFVNGQYEGKGKLYYKSGKIMHEGIFEKGKFISE